MVKISNPTSCAKKETKAALNRDWCPDCKLMFFCMFSCLVHAGICQAQSDSTAAQKPAEAGNTNLYLTEVVDKKLAEVNERLHEFLLQQMNLAVVGPPRNQFLETGMTIYEDYGFKSSSAQNKKTLMRIRFHVRRKGSEYIVEDCQISARKSLVVEFFKEFWNFDLKPNEFNEKNKLVIRYWSSDRIVLIRNDDGTALINVMKGFRRH